jgi:uncharacterized membrane protein
MAIDEPSTGPLQLLLIGFETTERFRGEVAREIAALRGRGLLRVLDARLLLRGEEGKLTEVDLNPLLADPPLAENPLTHLLGMNGGGNGGMTPQQAFHRTAGFALDDLRRLTDEIAPGDHALALLVEHVWAARLRETVREAGGRLVGQGFLTPEVTMIVGAEIQARADAQAAIELAEAARGAALLDALSTIAARESAPAEDRTRAAAEVVGALVDHGFVEAHEAGHAVAALATAGVLESALVEAAVAEAEDALGD